MKWRKFRDSLRRFGFAKAVYDLAYKVLQRTDDLLILEGVVVTGETIDKGFWEKPTRFDCRFLDRETVLRFAEDPRNEMTPDFARDALDHRDECFGILDGGVLASYGWYSSRPSRITELSEELLLHFDPRYLYMYKGYTLPSHRGERLHGLGMALALREALSRGYRGLVSSIEANNFSSLRSSYRMGYRRFGRVYVGKPFGKLRARATAGCRTYDFRVEPIGGRAADAALKEKEA